MSAFSLDEALKNVDDEVAINQIVGSLEKSLKQQSSQTQATNLVLESRGDSVSLSSSGQTYVSSISPSIANSANFAKSVESKNNYVNSTVNNNYSGYKNNNQNIQSNNNSSNSRQSGVTSHQDTFSSFVSNKQLQQSNVLRNPSIMPKNEPVKLVYPNNNNNNTQSTIVTMNNNNRVTFSTAPMNGSITLSPMTTNQQGQMQGTNIKIAQPQGSQASNVAPTLIFKNTMNSTQGGTTYMTNSPVTMSKTNNQASTSVVLPSNLFIRPSQPGQKQNAVGQQRVVINQQVVRNPNTITLQNLPQNIQGNTILLKQDNGQYQLLRIGPAQPGQQVTQGITQSGGSTIRLQTVPASIAPSNTVYVTTSTAPNHTQQILTQSTPVVSVAQMPALATATNQGSTGTVVVQQTTGQQSLPRNDNAKEKCRKFLTNLIDLSKREPAQVELNVRTLIQELVDGNVGPDDFCKKLENLLNAAPQPCLVGFLKKSLPLLRQSLVTKETVIEGINPPNPTVVSLSGATITTSQIPAQIRPIGQTVTTGNIGQTQIRMVQPTTPRIGQTTIRPTNPQIIRTTTPQVRPMTTIRGQTTIVQTNNQVPALHPVSGTTIITSGAQIRSHHANIARPATTVQIRPQQNASTVRVQKVQTNSMTKVQPIGSTQIKQIQVQVTNNSSVNMHNNNNVNTKIINNNIGNSNSNLKKQVSIATAVTNLTTNNNSTHVVNHSKASTISQINSKVPHLITKSISISATSNNSTTHTIHHQPPTTPTTINKLPIILNNKSSHHDHKKSQGSASKTKDKKTLASVVAATASANANSLFYPSSSQFGDDDINDVAAMGGVNLAEESQKILGSTEFVGTQIRSCKDEVLLNLPALQQRIRQQMARHGLEEPSTDIAVLISHAAQERLKNMIEKLAVISEHRLDILKIDPKYEIVSDVRGQIKFLEELDKAEQKRHEETEREMLLRAAKSRSKTEDPEQAKLKAKAKEMQRAEMEELRHREANNTALQAIGPRKKLKLDIEGTSTTGPGAIAPGVGKATARPRIKRVNMRDMIFLMEQEKDSCRSTALYKAYLK